MIPDCDLLRQFVEQGDEAAFAEVVRRHADLVYSAALRLTNGNSALAPDIAQQVFIDLARKATRLTEHPSLAGWLHRATRYHAYNIIRSEQRRQTREQESATMHENSSTIETDWSQISPLLDEAVGQLNAEDGEAVLLRFFQSKSHREVGEVLGLGEDSARKRLERAVEKLRKHFARKGVKISAALLTAEMASNSLQAAPVGLATHWNQEALAAKLILAPSLWSRFLDAIFMSSTKAKTLIVAATIIILVVLSYYSVPKPESARAIQSRTDTSQMVEAPVLAPVPVSNKEKSSSQSSSSGQDIQTANVVRTQHFTLSAAAQNYLLLFNTSREGIEGRIQSLLIDGGVDFPADANIFYVGGEVYLTNTSANLGRAEIVFSKLEQDGQYRQARGSMETRDFALPAATEDRLHQNPGRDSAALGELIKSMLIAGGVDFPEGAEMTYVDGKVYLTNTPANLDRAKVVFENGN